MKILSVLCLAAILAGAALPPPVESLRADLRAAEIRLQDASLELEAARRESLPLQDDVDQAREHASSWWGSWLLKRKLGKLKTSLDRVEEARQRQVEARQRLALLMTGADEELSSALQTSLQGDVDTVATWKDWWRQKRIWQLRLDALGPEGVAEEDGFRARSPEARKILAEARQAQWDRDKGLLNALYRKHTFSKTEWNEERRRLALRYAR